MLKLKRKAGRIPWKYPIKMVTFNCLKKDFKKETGRDASENLDLFLVYYYGRKSGIPPTLINQKMTEFEAWKNQTPLHLTRRSA